MSTNMYRSNLTRQSLTDSDLLILLGISQWVFNSNCHFVIEMIDKEHHGNSDVSWFEFLSLTAGQINNNYADIINTVLGVEISELFHDLINRRNKIMHSFPTGEKPDGYPIPMYRKSINDPYISIDKKYLEQFIADNSELSSKINEKRSHL